MQSQRTYKCARCGHSTLREGQLLEGILADMIDFLSKICKLQERVVNANTDCPSGIIKNIKDIKDIQEQICSLVDMIRKYHPYCSS